MMNLEGTIEILNCWAKQHPNIRKVLIYGSYCKENQNEDSDLDIALEFDPFPGHRETLATWINKADSWRQELLPKLGERLHLEWHDPDGETPLVAKGIRECSIVAYNRDISHLNV